MKIFDNGITTAAKCRGERKLVEKVAEMSIADMEPGSPYELLYGNDPACLEELRRLMVQQLGYEPAAVYQIGAAVAANSGPRVVGVAFTRKKESGILLSAAYLTGHLHRKMDFPLSSGFCSRWQAQNTTGKPNGRVRRTGSFLCGRMGRSWRKSPRLLRQTTLFLRLIPMNLTFRGSTMLCNWWRAGISTEK